MNLKLNARSFSFAHYYISRAFLDKAEKVDVGEWQSQDVSDRPEMVTWELRNVDVTFPGPATKEAAQQVIEPNLPWAEDHFLERVDGRPLNPPPSHEWWPFAQQGNAEHRPDGEKFSHTYPERFWPRRAGLTSGEMTHHGIRFLWGDLDDVIQTLRERPATRQAYLPIWFPEDATAARQGERVPCTLGYHFLQRGNNLHVNYYMRSCDFVRHFRDDIYMATRLGQYVAACLASSGYPDLRLGDVTFHLVSLHIFEPELEQIKKDAEHELAQRLHAAL